jgi:hypothetical protein
VVRDGIRVLNTALDAFPSGLGELPLVIDVQQLVCLHRIQVEAVCADELQRVPGLRVVASRNRDAALCP